MCEARIISITPPTALNANVKAYSLAPTLSAALDNLQPCTFSSVTPTGFTISNPNPLAVNSLIYFSWSAVGV